MSISFTEISVEDIDEEKSLRKRNSHRRFLDLMEDLEENPQDPLKISWEEGAVILKRGGDEIKRVTQFKAVYTRKPYKNSFRHIGNYIWEDIITDVFEVPKASNIYFQKDRLAYYTKALGGNPKKYIREYQACMFKAFIPEDLQKVAQKFCRTGKKRHWINAYVQQLNSKAGTIRQCIKDGQQNIIPLLIAQDGTYSVSEFRKLIGKSVWKKVLKNTETRNFLIGEGIRNHITPNSLEEALLYPSSILKYSCKNYPVESLHIIKKQKLITKTSKHQFVVNIITDTKNMYRQLDRVLPKQSRNWSLEKWEDRHSWCVDQINLKKYSKEKFCWLHDFEKSYVSENGNYTATLLDNAHAIRTEGDNMKHCVGSYSDRVKNGEYLVWSMKDSEGKHSSTLGAYISTKEGIKTARFNQHYKHCNQQVVCEEEVNFAKTLINKFNLQAKERKYNET